MPVNGVADNGVANAQTYGDRFRIPKICSDEGVIYKNRFVVPDPDGAGQIKTAISGDVNISGITSENMGGFFNGRDGSASKPYQDGDYVAVTIFGVELLDVAVTDDQSADYIQEGDWVVPGAEGKGVKWAAPSDLGDTSTTDVSADIEAYVKAYGTIRAKAMSNPDANGQVAVFVCGI